jgi:hypothetical protein
MTGAELQGEDAEKLAQSWSDEKTVPQALLRSKFRTTFL